jgi:hypothetical protein
MTMEEANIRQALLNKGLKTRTFLRQEDTKMIKYVFFEVRAEILLGGQI